MPKMSGAEALTEMLAGYEVSHLFMVPAILRRTLAEVERKTSIVRVQAHAEKGAAYMADGYARVAGRPGICMAQGVGALNLAAGLRDAWLGHAPVLAFTGGSFPETRFRHRYQDVEDISAFESVTKWNVTVDIVERFPDIVRQAFRVATSGCPGPVHLRFRGQEGEIDIDEAELEPLVEPEFRRVPPFRPRPERTRVEAAARCLEGAERPVIIAGGGVRASGAGSELVALAEKLAIPVATSLNGKDSIVGDHPLSVGVVGTYSRETANRVVKQADLAFFVGTEAGSMTTNFWDAPPPGTRAIQLDIEPAVIGRNYPVEVGILGDAKVSLRELLEEADGRTADRRSDWIAELQGIVASWRKQVDPLLTSEAVPMRPERICRALSELVPSDAIVLADTGHSGMWMGGMFDLTSPEQSYIRSAGHLGWAFPAGLGATCAASGRPVVTFSGDAGFWYHLGELETAVRSGMNAVTVINNNSSGNQSERGFDRAYGGEQTEKARELWTYNDVDFAYIAEAMGALGIRVERPAELGPAIERGLEADRPVVIDVVTDIEAMAPLAYS